MKRTSAFGVAIILIGLIVPTAHAQGKASWSDGYPKTGTVAGTILVKGTTQPDPGWSVTGNALIVAWPVMGGPTKNAPIKVNADGTWGEGSIGGLTSGVKYNVVVQVAVKMGLTQTTVATPVGIATAK